MPRSQKLFSFVITDENKTRLKEMSEQHKLTMSKTLNSIIATYPNNNCEKISKIDDNIDTNSKRIELKTHVTNDEYQALKSLAQKEFLSVKRYIKFLISQKIYNNCIPSNSEIIELQEIKNQLIRLGVNLNTIAKKANLKEVDSRSKQIMDLLDDTLKNIIQDKENLDNKILAFKKINNSRF